MVAEEGCRSRSEAGTFQLEHSVAWEMEQDRLLGDVGLLCSEWEMICLAVGRRSDGEEVVEVAAGSLSVILRHTGQAHWLNRGRSVVVGDRAAALHMQ